MIKKITLKNVSIFKGLGAADIKDLSGINLMYGANGSGKTTISNYLSSPADDKYIDCAIEWENDDPLDCFVYNKKFKDENLKSRMKGVFTLGQASSEEVEKIEMKKLESVELDKKIASRISTIDKFLDEKKNHIDRAKEIFWQQIRLEYSDLFKDALKGTGTKENFYKKVIAERDRNCSTDKSLENLRSETATLFSGELMELPLLEDIDIDERVFSLESHDILSKIIIGKEDVGIAKLINQLNINDWVDQGRKTLSIESSICPFCQSETIDVDFRQQLESYFDKEYNESLALLEEIKRQYSSHTDSVIQRVDDLVQTEKSNPNSKLSSDEVWSQLKLLRSKVSNNLLTLNSKIKEPSKIIVLKSLKEEIKLIYDYLKEANEKITENNALYRNRKSAESKLIEDTWAFIIQQNNSIIDTELNKIDNKQKAISGIKVTLNGDNNDNQGYIKEKSKLDEEIKDLSRGLTSVQPSVNSINETLKRLEFNNFEIVPTQDDSNYYQIQREDGSIANDTLSEGEVSLITFLYFLQWVEGSFNEANVTSNRVVIIDDPISSLDSNILFLVSTLVKGLFRSSKGTDKVKQVIILTHNIYFYKEISYNNGEKDKYRHYVIKRSTNNSAVISHGTENPIKSSYELLWSEIKNQDHCSDITIQNVLRRIIENYFKNLGGYSEENIIKYFNENKEDEAILRSLICWTHDGSHCIPDDFHISSGYTKEMYLRVFKQIFTKFGHISHYNMMMGIPYSDSNEQTNSVKEENDLNLAPSCA